MKTKSLLLFVLILNAKLIFASSIGVMEYTKSPAELEHTAVLYPTKINNIRRICYSVCRHEQEIGMKCSQNRLVTGCLKQKDYFDSLEKSFQVEKVKALADRLEWNEKNLERFRASIENNGDDKQAQQDYMNAIKVVDDLRNQITTLKTTPNYVAYQKIISLLSDDDEENTLGYTVNRASNWESWQFVITPFWGFRMENVLAVWEKELGVCEFHANGTKVTQAQKLNGNCLSRETLAVSRTWTEGETLKRGSLQQYFDAYYDGYIEVRSKVFPVPKTPPSKPVASGAN